MGKQMDASYWWTSKKFIIWSSHFVSHLPCSEYSVVGLIYCRIRCVTKAHCSICSMICVKLLFLSFKQDKGNNGWFQFFSVRSVAVVTGDITGLFSPCTSASNYNTAIRFQFPSKASWLLLALCYWKSRGHPVLPKEREVTKCKWGLIEEDRTSV